MPFPIALTGINAALAGLRTSANNIANSGTVGFRQSRAEFVDLPAAARPSAPGKGVRVSQITQQNEQDSTGGSKASTTDIAEQLLNMIQYSLQLKAQANVIRTAKENTESVANLIGERDSR